MPPKKDAKKEEKKEEEAAGEPRVVGPGEPWVGRGGRGPGGCVLGRRGRPVRHNAVACRCQSRAVALMVCGAVLRRGARRRRQAAPAGCPRAGAWPRAVRLAGPRLAEGGKVAGPSLAG